MPNDSTMDNTENAYNDYLATTTKGKLMADLRLVLADAEEMLRAAAATTGDRAVQLREKAAASLRTASDKMVDMQLAAVERSKVAARATDDYVHESPWQAIGIAAGVGFLLGLVVSRG